MHPRAKAIAEGSTRYFTGKPCPKGHVSFRMVSNCSCIECDKQTMLSWLAAHPGKMTDYARKCRHKNPEPSRRQARKYRRTNPGKRAAFCADHRAARIKRTPSWADHAKIQVFYIEAQKLTAESGQLHHVDHIVPLKGRLVSGLHVHQNLQVLTAVQNVRKHASFQVA